MSSQLRRHIAKQVFKAFAVNSSNSNVNGLAAAISLQNKKGELPEFRIPLDVLPHFLSKDIDVDKLNRTNHEIPMLATNVDDTNGRSLSISLERNAIVQDVLGNVMRNFDTLWSNNVKFSSIQRQKVIVEFSSPNIAKPFHAGHLRSTVIGNFVANICQAVGHSVHRINYLGDWGSQFGVLSKGYQLFGDDNSFNKDPIRHLYEVYVKASSQITQDKQFEEATREESRLLEEGEDSVVTSRWKTFRKHSVAHLQETYKRLNIEFDAYEGESMYSLDASVVCDRLAKFDAVTTKEDGAKVISYDHPNGTKREVVIQKSNGSSLYITRDIAAAISRMEQHNFDIMFYVVENGQSDHFIGLKEILSRMERSDLANKLRHIRFGRIRGMSTRQGNVAFLDDILDEAKSRSLMAMEQTSTTKVISCRELVADILGISAVVINDLKCKRQSDVDFNWEKIVQTKGETGIFLQYVHARLCSLELNCGVTLNPNCDLTFLAEPEALDLLSLMIRYEDVCFETYNDLESNYLVGYLFQLAHGTNIAFKKLTIKGKSLDVAQARLLLFVAAKKIIANGMIILGLRPLQKM